MTAALSRLLPSKTTPLAWALHEEARQPGTLTLLFQIGQYAARRRTAASAAGASRALRTWLDRAAGSTPDVGYALEALCWCHALPRLAAVLPPAARQELLEHLLRTATEAGQIELEQDPLLHQLLAGELPLTLGCLFAEIPQCRKLGSLARRGLSRGLTGLVDREGLPQAKHLDLLRPLLACWTRCRALGNRLPKACWSRLAQKRYGRLVRQALRLTRGDGSPVFSQGSADDRCDELLDAAVRLGGDRQDRRIAALVLPGRKRSRVKRFRKRSLPPAATHSHRAATSVLRPGWSRSDPRLTVLFAGQSVELELEVGGEVIGSGPWEFEIRRAGRLVEPQSGWHEVGWISDDAVDYLELEILLADGLRVQRHIVLAREDGFLFLADAVLGQQRTRLEYRGWLPLGRRVSFHPAEESREGFLVGKKRRAVVLPLALPEWRCSARPGTLAQTGRGLELCQSAEGHSLFAPLFVDLQPRRITRPLTWRQLTVAGHLAVQPADAAVGYRVMVGKEQWLIYRSLTRPANRTLLGHNLSSETLVARFGRDGEVRALVEIR